MRSKRSSRRYKATADSLAELPCYASLRAANCGRREADRLTAICQLCDTDFMGIDWAGGGRFESAARLSDHIAATLGPGAERRLVVLTGGEPLLQLDHDLVAAVHARGFAIVLETSGTNPVPEGIDWICGSPTANTELRQRSGRELKLVFPQVGISPEQFEELPTQHFLLQPMDGREKKKNTELAVAYCLANPR